VDIRSKTLYRDVTYIALVGGLCLMGYLYARAK